MSLSKIPKFYKLSVAERLREVHERGILSKEDYLSLLKGDHLLDPASADKMIENWIIGDWEVISEKKNKPVKTDDSNGASIIKKELGITFEMKDDMLDNH